MSCIDIHAYWVYYIDLMFIVNQLLGFVLQLCASSFMWETCDINDLTHISISNIFT